VALADGPVRLQEHEGGALWQISLATPTANILDRQKMGLLAELFARAGEAKGLKAIVLAGDGPHFSFGASVSEHLPGQYPAMLSAFHTLIDCLLDASVVTLAAVQGRCLGGALELVSLAHRIYASPNATLGLPEITLGVFPPLASVSLQERIGRGPAEDLCLSGRLLGAAEALQIGLVDEVAPDPWEAACAYVRHHLLPRSASSLRLAARALRSAMAARIRRDLPAAESLYCGELMATADATEGLAAFLAKRPPMWRDA